MEKPLVSVIMITYGHENYIKLAIEGVFMQKTSFPIELIIANDCSPDNSHELILKLTQNSPENIIVKYIYHSKNIGMMNNFVSTLDSANSKYIALCDGDDYWIDPLKLQKQVDFLEADENCSLVFHGVNVLSENHSEYDENLYKDLETTYYSDKDLLTQWLIPTASAVFRNQKDRYLLRLKNPKYYFGDIVLFLSLAQFGKMYCMKEKMGIYRINAGGATKRDNTNLKYERIAVHLETLSKDFNGKYHKHFSNRAKKIYWMLTKYNLKKLNFKFVSYLYKYISV